MKTLFLHGGLPKTGSTSIQNFLFEERVAMAAAGFLFPAPSPDASRSREGGGKHASLLAALQGRWDDLVPGEWDLWVDEFRRFREDPGLHTLILSHETMGNRAGTLKFDLIKPLVEDYTVRILLVVREAEVWLTSLYQQRIMGRQRESGSAHQLNTIKTYLEFGYQGRIAALQAAFPGAKITIAPFEEMVKGDGLVPNAADILGLPAEFHARAAEAKRANTSLSHDAIEVLRRCNAAGLNDKDFLAIRGAVSTSQRRSNAPKPKRERVMRRRVARRIADRYALDRAWVQSEFGVVLQPSPDRNVLPNAIPDDRIAAVVSAAEPLLAPEQIARLLAAVRDGAEPKTQPG